MITQVRVRDAKDDTVLFEEYLEVPGDADDADEIIQNALAAAFFTYGARHGKMIRLNLNKEVVLAAYLEKKLSTYEIGDLYGVASETVARWLRLNGAELREPARRRHSPPDEQRRRVIALVRSGATRAEMMQATGISKYYLREVLADADIRLVPGRKRKGAKNAIRSAEGHQGDSPDDPGGK